MHQEAMGRLGKIRSPVGSSAISSKGDYLRACSLLLYALLGSWHPTCQWADITTRAVEMHQKITIETNDRLQSTMSDWQLHLCVGQLGRATARHSRFNVTVTVSECKRVSNVPADVKSHDSDHDLYPRPLLVAYSQQAWDDGLFASNLLGPKSLDVPPSSGQRSRCHRGHLI